MATSLTPRAELRTSLAAPVPRPPQPISPTLITSLPAARTAGRPVNRLATAPPTSATLDCFRKLRRDDLALFSSSWFAIALSSLCKLKTVAAPPFCVRASARLIPGLILFGHLRFQTFEIVLLLERAYYSEADKQRVGVPPNALGKLRVLLAPFASRGAARGRTQACGVIVP